MPSVRNIAEFLERFAPTALAESWDQVGLLVGDPEANVRRLMTCLTVTPTTAQEALDERAELIVSHHPFPFRAVHRITRDTPSGRLLYDLIAGHVAIYSPHTAFDSARHGINQRLAEGLQLVDIAPLVPAPATDASLVGAGTGRQGRLSPAQTLTDFAAHVQRWLGLSQVHVVGQPQQPVERVAVVCGSAADLLPAAWEAGCDCVVSGEMRFHTCLEVEARSAGLILTGHFASERFGVERLAQVLAAEFAELRVWPSQQERDPLWVTSPHTGG